MYISMATFMQTHQLCPRTTEMFQQIIGRYEQAEAVISLFIFYLVFASGLRSPHTHVIFPQHMSRNVSRVKRSSRLRTTVNGGNMFSFSSTMLLVSSHWKTFFQVILEAPICPLHGELFCSFSYLIGEELAHSISKLPGISGIKQLLFSPLPNIPVLTFWLIRVSFSMDGAGILVNHWLWDKVTALYWSPFHWLGDKKAPIGYKSDSVIHVWSYEKVKRSI